jgi:hypothetical protein
MFSGFAWALWVSRNKIAIEKKMEAANARTAVR